MIIIRSLWLLVWISACSAAPAKFTESAVQKIEATILSVSDQPPITSGLVSAWVVMEVAVQSEHQLKLYVPYLVEEQEFPPVGAVCSFEVREKYIDGISTFGDVPQDVPQLVTESLRCDGEAYRY